MKLFGIEVTKEKMKKFIICFFGAVIMTGLTFWVVGQLWNVGDLLTEITGAVRINISKP